MKRILPVLLFCAAAGVTLAEIPASYYSRTIFTDDFSADGFGKRWGHYKSNSVVKDGVLHGITAETSDHNAVDHIVIEPERDLEVSVKFRFVSDQAKGFNVWFDDKNYKGSHAGHICSVNVSAKDVRIADAKLGTFKNEYYDKTKAGGKLTDEEKAVVASKAKSFPVQVSQKDWHTLVIRTKGDEVEASIDGKPAGAFKSEGVGHDTKTLVSLTTNKVDVDYDDFSIKGAAK